MCSTLMDYQVMGWLSYMGATEGGSSGGRHARGRQKSLTHESKRNCIARAPSHLELEPALCS